MNDIEIIHSKIYEIRGQRIMLDFDLAEMYGVENKALKQAVRRNIGRSPSDFMFELTKDEFEHLRLQIVTSNGRGGTRYMPFASTHYPWSRTWIQTQRDERAERTDDAFL